MRGKTDRAIQGMYSYPLPTAFQVCVLPVGPGTRMALLTLEQFGAATAQAVQRVEALAQSLSVCRQAFRESLAEAEVLNDAQSGLYLMDVGGAPFHTRTEVLHRHEGMLSAMASADFSHDVEGGKYAFLDRDPTWFPLVLQFLRTGVALLPNDTERRLAVFREAQYYSLEGLCRAARPLQEQIIVMGYNETISYFSCEMYNPLRKSWERMVVDMGALPDGRLSFCGGDGCLFAIEMADDESAGSVLKFCPAARTWTVVVSSNPINDRDSSWAYHRGYLHGSFDDCVQSLSVSTGQWETLPPLTRVLWETLSTTRVNATLCVVEGRLFVVGGGTASVEEYVAVEQRWVSIPDMPRAVEDAAAVALDGKLLVIGGWNKDLGTLSATLEYDPEDGTWKELPGLLTARSWCAVTVLGGDIAVVGGFGSNHEGLTSAERYNRRLQCWEAMPSLTDPLRYPAAVVVQI